MFRVSYVFLLCSAFVTLISGHPFPGSRAENAVLNFSSNQNAIKLKSAVDRHESRESLNDFVNKNFIVESEVTAPGSNSTFKDHSSGDEIKKDEADLQKVELKLAEGDVGKIDGKVEEPTLAKNPDTEFEKPIDADVSNQVSDIQEKKLIVSEGSAVKLNDPVKDEAPEETEKPIALEVPAMEIEQTKVAEATTPKVEDYDDEDALFGNSESAFFSLFGR